MGQNIKESVNCIGRYEYHILLNKIYKKYSPKEFGFIIQHLLALTLCQIGVVITHYGRTDRYDVKFRYNNDLYVMEVRMRREDRINLKDMFERLKNEPGLKRISILEFIFPARWLIIDLDNQQGEYIVSALLYYLDQELTNQVNNVFPDILCRYFNHIHEFGEGWLYDHLLKQRGCILDKN